MSRSLRISSIEATFNLFMKHDGDVILKSEFIGSAKKHCFGCKFGHPDWFTSYDCVVNAGTGCPKCKLGRSPFTHKHVEKRIYQKHKEKLYLNSAYQGMLIKHDFVCDKGHEWKATCHNIINGGTGCPECAGLKPLTLEIHELRIKENHKSRLQRISTHSNLNQKHTFECVCGKIWNSFIQKISGGSGCPKCNRPCLYSGLGLKWTKEWKSIIPYKLKTALSGEMTVYGSSGNWYKADGYCSKLNLILEFDGDDFHGNPNKHAPHIKCHPFRRNLTAHELYQKTINKRKDLVTAGYTVVSVWESDYNNGFLYSSIRGKRHVKNEIQQYIA